MDKEPSSFPSFEDGEYPEILQVAELDINHVELERRLQVFMDELPRLKTDYWAATALIAREGRALTLVEFREICNRISLREEVFTTLDIDKFEEFLSDNLRIARERGSHP